MVDEDYEGPVQAALELRLPQVGLPADPKPFMRLPSYPNEEMQNNRRMKPVHRVPLVAVDGAVLMIWKR